MRRMSYLSLAIPCEEDVEITYIKRGNDPIEVNFEQARLGGFNSFTVREDGAIIMRDGFSDEMISFLMKFFNNGIDYMRRKVADEINKEKRKESK